MLEIEKAPAVIHAAQTPGCRRACRRARRICRSRTAVGSGQFLVPIETPLVTPGLYPETLARFGKDFAAWGMTAMAGGTGPRFARRREAQARRHGGDRFDRGRSFDQLGLHGHNRDRRNRILACGHPLFGFGAVQMPLSRAHVIMTLASSAGLDENHEHRRHHRHADAGPADRRDGHARPGPADDSAGRDARHPCGAEKIPFRSDRKPAADSDAGGAPPHTTVSSAARHTAKARRCKWTARSTVKGHTPVKLEDLFAPTDQTTPAAFYVATEVHGRFRANLFESLRAAANRTTLNCT